MLQDQLDRKEYLLQQNELKVYHYEKYLQRKGLLDAEARQLLNKFQLDDIVQDQRVSNVVGDNLALKEQLKETIKDVNRLDKQSFKQKNIIAELKSKIEKMKNKHAEALKHMSQSPAITASDRKVKLSNMEGR